MNPDFALNAAGLRCEKILPLHLERLAIVYVRQSTLQQVATHTESTRLQYGLVSRATALGWPEERILVIDEDLGKSAASIEARFGFQRLVSEVSLDHVGAIIGMEISRLARCSSDWHQLLEICALFNTLIADIDGVYNPRDYNDRLLLGLKGTILLWKKPNRMTLQCLLKNPLYTGAYVYGRRQVDSRKQKPGRPATGRIIVVKQQ